MKRNYKEATEHELTALLCESDQRAFSELYDRYSVLIWSYAKRFLHDDCLADDVMQETFIILWEKRNDLEIRTSLVNYLHGITKFRALQNLRKSKRLQDYLGTLAAKIEQYERSPEEYVINQERVRIIEIEINRLPERMKAIIKLTRTGEYSYREIAEQFNVSPGAIKDQVHHATKKLRFKLVRLLHLLF